MNDSVSLPVALAHRVDASLDGFRLVVPECPHCCKTHWHSKDLLGLRFSGCGNEYLLVLAHRPPPPEELLLAERAV